VNTIQVLQRLNRETKAEVYLVGGFVRDYLRNKKNNDLDVVVRNYSPRNLKKFLTRHGSLKEVKLAKTSDTEVAVLLFKAKGDDLEAQISLPRRGKLQIPDSRNTLKQDVRFRDLTINCLYLPINYKSRKDVIDMVGGVQDIKERRIKANGSAVERFRESPVRMLRVLSIAARTDYTIDKDTLDAVEKCSHLMSKVPMEVVRVEFDKMLMSRKPSKYLRLLNKTGLLKYISPEIQACVGCKQDKRYHKYDVFTHLIYTADHADRDLIIRLAGLMHDVGKAPTRKEVRVNGERLVTFHKHEMLSVKLAREFLRRLKYEKAIIDEVLLLVRLHMYHYTREWTDGAIRKFIKRASLGEEWLTEDRIGQFPLFRLRVAERLGSGFKNIGVTERQKDFEARILRVYNESRTLEVKDLAINGENLMSVFKIPQGKTIGDILRHLLELVLEEPELNERMTLLKLATEYIAKIGDKDGKLRTADTKHTGGGQAQVVNRTSELKGLFRSATEKVE
jgi:putative nucleotidyltransferase with HDIG domain